MSASSTTPDLTLASSSSSSSFPPSRDNQKNRYGSLDELQSYALQTRNHSLTTKLVEAKQSWEALQANYRATLHARFLYQTTLARIVHHVQDFSDQDDPIQLQLLCDLLKWTKECEHLVSTGHGLNDSSSTSEEDDSGSLDVMLQGQDNSSNICNINHGLMSGSNRTPIIDYNDVQVYVDTSLQAHTASSLFHSHESLQDQNGHLAKEIAKWQASMARIRLCHRREAHELMTHKKTLQKVVQRILESDFARWDQVLEWFQHCQEQVRNCGSRSVSEQDGSNAAKHLCQRCNSKLSTDDGNCQEESGARTVEAKTPLSPPLSPQKARLRVVESSTMACPDTPTTVATHCDNEETAALANDEIGKEDESMVKHAIQLAHDEVHQHKNAAAIHAEHELKESLLPTPRDVAAANVDDPPDRITATSNATNLQATSIVQDNRRHAGCGAGTCCIM